jgi:two-component system sensor histidine kinase ChvG
VNLITNAISFCEDGDAVRVWARRRDNRVLVVVEDTGPGIPEQALTKVFKRFYSDRPPTHFGNNSGLGPFDLETDRRGAWRRDLG